MLINDSATHFGLLAVPSRALDARGVERRRSFATSGDLANFSYARFDDEGALLETAEKQVISTRAIAVLWISPRPTSSRPRRPIG